VQGYPFTNPFCAIGTTTSISGYYLIVNLLIHEHFFGVLLSEHKSLVEGIYCIFDRFYLVGFQRV
jgi:hypothetical protein